MCPTAGQSTNEFEVNGIWSWKNNFRIRNLFRVSPESAGTRRRFRGKVMQKSEGFVRKVFLEFLARKSDAFLPSRAGVAKNFEDGDRTVRQVFWKCNDNHMISVYHETVWIKKNDPRIQWKVLDSFNTVESTYWDKFFKGIQGLISVKQSALVNGIIRLMKSVCLGPKVIPLSDAHCSAFFFECKVSLGVSICLDMVSIRLSISTFLKVDLDRRENLDRF